VETNALLTAINAHLATFLRAAGHRATVVPPTHNFDEQRLMSDWSHKHVAYIAGLGTFGIHHMLITADGCCGRLNSLVTDLVIPPTPRPEVEACLYKADGSCRACLPRCPVDALTGPRFDRHACYDVCLQNAARHTAVGLADVCGKCACVVPCSFVNPNRQLETDHPR
jgi:epoxyqueuosine reductase QueG